MKKFTRQAVWIAAVLLTAVPATAETLRIGHLATMSGPIGGLGQDQYDGFMLGLAQRNSKLAGHNIEVVRGDDQGKPDVGVQVAKDLLEREKVRLVVGITASNVINAVFPVITGAGIPLLGTNGGPSIFAGEKCSPLFASTAFQNDGFHEAAGAEAQSRGYKNVIIIAPNYQAGKDAVVGFKRFYKGAVADEIYPAFGQTDFSAEIARFAASPSDAFYVFLPGGMGINFMKQLSQAGLVRKVPLLSAMTVEDMSLPIIKESALGTTVSAYWTSAANTPQSQSFVKDFQARYKRTPSVFAAQGYDAAMLLEQALKANPAAVADPKALAKALRSTKFVSVRGEVTIGNNGFPIQDYLLWKVVKTSAGVGFEKDHVILSHHQDAYAAHCPLK
ncbi:MAG: ABC transporter substrate-binding protein [Rhodocyclaceae bacterium]|nr:MAG: ABC transporter substrate-binding protein [Rhodocyclaceae bacterium]